MSKQIPPATRKVLHERSGGVCEGCGLRRATDAHHRQYRSRGGSHAVSNLLALCGGAGGLPGGNYTGCHGISHTAEGEARGWSIRSGYNPAEVPAQIVLDGLRVYVHLTADGGHEVIPDADAIEYLELIHAREGA